MIERRSKMKFNFRKIASVIASAVMIGSTLGTALAANYPVPFVSGGTADGAIVVTSGTHTGAAVDWDAAVGLQTALQGLVTSTTSTTSAAITGEAAALFSGGTKLYVNDTLNSVKTILTKSDLPTILADGSFSGNVDATMTFTIDVGSNPKVTWAKQPTSSDNPNYALAISTGSTSAIYNSVVTFNKAVNLTHADSEGQSITLFGQKYTIGSATSLTDLVLLKSAEKVDLSSDANPSQQVTIEGKTYTIELVSASDTAATIKVTDSAGTSESREVTEAASKKINGITVAVINADETNLKLTASVVAGSDKITLVDGSAIAKGEEGTAIDGTNVEFTGGPSAMTKIAVNISAPDSDHDAIKAGSSFVDPVFGNFKLDFAGLNIPSDNSTAREEIAFTTSGVDKEQIKFTDYRGLTKTFVYAKNTTAIGTKLMVDDDYHNITVMERQPIHYQEYVVVGNQDEGYLLKLSSVKNSTTGTNNDYVKFTDAFSGDVLETVWSGDGIGTISIGGKSYGVQLSGDSSNATEDYVVRLNYPDSSGDNTAILFPTIKTSKGALVMLTDTLDINTTGWYNDSSGVTYNLTSLKVPNGDGYTAIALANEAGGVVDVGGTDLVISGNIGVAKPIGNIMLNFTVLTNDTLRVRVAKPTGTDLTAGLYRPKVVIFEGKDDNNAYNTMVVSLTGKGVSSDELGVDTVESSWTNTSSSSSTWATTMASDSNKAQLADLWGTIALVDSSDSSDKTATISYPKEQLYAQIYMGANAAAITPGQAGGAGGTILVVKDTEVASVSSKNLVVVGGSCINTVAAKVLGSDVPVCGADFTTKTSVDAGKYLIQSVASPYNTGKVAVLVAGYEAAETKNAVLKLKEGVATDVGTKIVGPTVA
jgi:hypothetical protein